MQESSNVLNAVLSFFWAGKSGKKSDSRTSTTFIVEGPVRVFAQGQLAVKDTDVVIDDETWVIGNIAPGVSAKISGIWQGGVRHARKVIVSH